MQPVQGVQGAGLLQCYKLVCFLLTTIGFYPAHPALAAAFQNFGSIRS